MSIAEECCGESEMAVCQIAEGWVNGELCRGRVEDEGREILMEWCEL